MKYIIDHTKKQSMTYISENSYASIDFSRKLISLRQKVKRFPKS